jgi:hypothetical protein
LGAREEDHVKINPVPVEGTLLFRAHQQPAADPPLAYLSLALRVLFNEEYRRVNSVEVFLRTLQNHLGKMDLERKGSRLKRSKFTSTSPDLDWTIHLTGQKAKLKKEADWVGLVVFDLQRLSEAPGLTVIKVSDIFDFNRNRPYSNLIEGQYQIWASNCNEYLLMGSGIKSGIIQLIPWTRLESMPIIHPWFLTWYTLKLYCDRVNQKARTLPITEQEKACQMVVESGKILAGERSVDMKYSRHIVQLILKPTVGFWAIRTENRDEDLGTRCEMIIQEEKREENEIVEGLGQISV